MSLTLTAAMESSKASFIEMLKHLGGNAERKVFLNWIEKEVIAQLPDGYGKEANSENEYEDVACKRKVLTRVSEFLRDRCIPEGAEQGATLNGSVWSSERLQYPNKFIAGEDDDPSPTTINTVHLDSFLYDEADEEAMVESGSLSRAYCKGMNSGQMCTGHFLVKSPPLPSR